MSRGDWMHTYTGGKFYPLDPRPEDIHPEDLAHSLSLQCRYNGMTKVHYSVAEHCVLLSRQFPTAELASWALWHDAAEAFIGDIIRPVKQYLPSFAVIEDRILRAVAERFGLDGHVIPTQVRELDIRILLDESAALFDNPHPREALAGLDPIGVDIPCWSAEDAKRAYLD